MTALDPGDYAHDDEAAHLAGAGDHTIAGEREVLVGEVDESGALDGLGVPPGEVELPDGVSLDGTEPEGCPHPEHARRLTDPDEQGQREQVCSLCWEVVPIAAGVPAIVPKSRPGTDPTMRLGGGDLGPGGLRHISYDPAAPQKNADGSITTRPYTPDEVERELVDTMWRIESGAGWLTTKEEERSAAKLAYELAHARAIYESKGRSAEQREAEALLRCRREYEDWQLLELTCKTAREGLHNLRAKGSYLQTVNRSVGDALRGAR